MPAYEKGQLLPELEAAVWDQPRNYITEPIKVTNGFLVLKVDEHYKAGLASFGEVENEVQNKMMNERLGPAERAYLSKLRLAAFANRPREPCPCEQLQRSRGAIQSKLETQWSGEILNENSRRHLSQMPRRFPARRLSYLPGTQVNTVAQSVSKF